MSPECIRYMAFVETNSYVTLKAYTSLPPLAFIPGSSQLSFPSCARGFYKQMAGDALLMVYFSSRVAVSGLLPKAPWPESFRKILKAESQRARKPENSLTVAITVLTIVKPWIPITERSHHLCGLLSLQSWGRENKKSITPPNNNSSTYHHRKNIFRAPQKTTLHIIIIWITIIIHYNSKSQRGDQYHYHHICWIVDNGDAVIFLQFSLLRLFCMG